MTKDTSIRNYPEFIPENMEKWVRCHRSVLQVAWNRTDVVNGYGQIDTITVFVLIHRTTCERCGYNDWDDDQVLWEKCNRHCYKNDYYCVFSHVIESTVQNKEIKT